MNHIRRFMAPVLLFAAVALLQYGCSRNVQTSGSYNLPAGANETVSQARGVLEDFTSETGTNIPPAVLERAEGIAIIPGITKAAFVVGGRHGTGVLMNHEGNQWSLPVFASISGASVGYQIGISDTDLILVFQNQNALDKLLQGAEYTLGGDLTVAAGPVGATANLTAYDADVLAYRRTEGAFAGAAISGSRLSVDPEETYAYYIRPGSESARGYYAEDGRALMSDLLNPRGKLNIENVPPNATQLRQTLQQVTGGRRT